MNVNSSVLSDLAGCWWPTVSDVQSIQRNKWLKSLLIISQRSVFLNFFYEDKWFCLQYL